MSRDVPTTAILPVHHTEAVIDALAAAGLEPADDSPIRWVADRWHAVAEAGDLLVLAYHDVDNERVRWSVTDRFGVIYADGEFPVNEIGLAMLTAALLAAATEGRPVFEPDDPPGGDDEQSYPSWLEDDDEFRDRAEEAYNANPANFI